MKLARIAPFVFLVCSLRVSGVGIPAVSAAMIQQDSRISWQRPKKGSESRLEKQVQKLQNKDSWLESYFSPLFCRYSFLPFQRVHFQKHLVPLVYDYLVCVDLQDHQYHNFWSLFALIFGKCGTLYQFWKMSEVLHTHFWQRWRTTLIFGTGVILY